MMNNVLLRPWKKEDAQPLAAIANNRRVWNYVRDAFPNPYTVMDALQWISKESTAKPLVNFAIIYEGEVAGSVGIILQDDVYRKTVEIGYFTGEKFWGKGIATQAVGLLLPYITTTFDIVRITARVFENNKESMKVLQKNGFYLESIQRKAGIKNNEVLDVYVWVKLI